MIKIIIPTFFLFFIVSTNVCGGIEKDYAFSYFINFVQQHGKKYENKEHYFARFNIFYENLMKINDLNNKHPNTRFGVTKFADLTSEEFTARHSCLSSNINQSLAIVYEVTQPIGPELDWRGAGIVTGVKDQGICYTCWAFSTTGEVEGQNALNTGKLLTLSEQQLINCADSGRNCGTGSLPHIAMNDAAILGGLMTEYQYPYENGDDICKFNESLVAVRIKGGVQIKVDEESLAGVLTQHGPLSIGITVSPQFQSYISGILDPTDCNEDANHAVLLVGYTNEYWLIKNSWGLIQFIQGMPQLIRDLDHPSTSELDAVAEASLEDRPVVGTHEMDDLRRTYLNRKALNNLLKRHGARRIQERRQDGEDRADDEEDLVYELDDFKSGLLFDFSKGIIGS